MKGSVYHISQLILLISREFILLRQRIAYEDTDAFHGIQWKAERPGLCKDWNLPPGTQLQKCTNLYFKALELMWLNSQQLILMSLSLNAKENQIGPVWVKSAFLGQQLWPEPHWSFSYTTMLREQRSQTQQRSSKLSALVRHVITQSWGQKNHGQLYQLGMLWAASNKNMLQWLKQMKMNYSDIPRSPAIGITSVSSAAHQS